MFDKAAGCCTDLDFLDLKDAVPPAIKEESRTRANGVLDELNRGRTVRTIRINALDTKWCHDDVIDVVTQAGANLDPSTPRRPDSARGADRGGGGPG